MTLGLAFCCENAIYGAIDSFGTSLEVMPTKLRVFPNKMMLLTAGGLQHWKVSLKEFIPQRAMQDNARELATRLDSCMKGDNQAYGLLCGFENSEPVCFRLNRAVGASACEIVLENLRKIQPIGWPKGVNVQDVANRAFGAIDGGGSPMATLSGEIKRCVMLCKEVVEPIDEAQLVCRYP